MGSRSRKRGRTDLGAAAAPAPPPEPKLRGEAANAAIRDQLTPLEPGERPTPLIVAAVVATVMAAANIIATIAGANLSTSEKADNTASFTVMSTGLLALAAVGLWRAKYWGIMGFQAILAFQILILSIAVTRVERWWYGLIVTVVIGLLGWLFWKLVRVLARVQTPTR